MGKIKQALDVSASQKCAFIKVYDQLDAEDVEAINNAIDKGASGYLIANALGDGGYKIAQSTVTQHLTKRCRCKGRDI